MGVSLALPPLLVRIAYSLGSTFSSASSHSRWSPITGDWRLYLGLGVVAEYLVVLAYVITGAFTPLHRDDDAQTGGAGPYRASEDGLLEMGKPYNNSTYGKTYNNPAYAPPRV
jgi:hypothetical protein